MTEKQDNYGEVDAQSGNSASHSSATCAKGDNLASPPSSGGECEHVPDTSMSGDYRCCKCGEKIPNFYGSKFIQSPASSEIQQPVSGAPDFSHTIQELIDFVDRNNHYEYGKRLTTSTAVQLLRDIEIDCTRLKAENDRFKQASPDSITVSREELKAIVTYIDDEFVIDQHNSIDVVKAVLRAAGINYETTKQSEGIALANAPYGGGE